MKLARAHAALAGRDYVTPDDVKAVAVPALAHRLVLRTELWVRRVRPETVIEEIVAVGSHAAGRRPRAECGARSGTARAGRAGTSVVTRAFGTARLHTFVVLAAVGLVAALATGRPELAALAAPFAVALVVGIAAASHPRVAVAVELDADRVVQGDTVTVTVTLDGRSRHAAGRGAARSPRGIEIVEPPGAAAWTVAVRAGEPRVLTATVVTRDVGPLRPRSRRAPRPARARSPGVGVDAPVAARVVRVLPDAGTLRRIVRPFDTRNDNGNQVARALGDGIEFADVRPFRPGDRASRVNWRVSARRGETYVNDQHPERNADAVLLLDTFADDQRSGSATLDRAVRAACSLSTAMLATRDRVGIVSLGGSTDWVTPGMGERARFVIVDHLLGSVARWTEAERSLRWLPPAVLPPRALVVVLSPLVDERMLRAIVDVRRRGFDTTVIELAPALPPPVPTPPRDGCGCSSATSAATRSRRSACASRPTTRRIRCALVVAAAGPDAGAGRHRAAMSAVPIRLESPTRESTTRDSTRRTHRGLGPAGGRLAGERRWRASSRA